MKKLSFFFVSMITMLCIECNDLSAQDNQSGTIKYQQIIHFDFSFVLEGRENEQQMVDFVAGLPEESSSMHMLHFTTKEALFVEDVSEKDAAPPGLQRAQHVLNMGQPPKPALLKVYYNLKKEEKIEQMEFLTRIFQVNSEIESLDWKLNADKKKILDYTCMSASTVVDDQNIVAWFAPEIPVALGPGNYGGLPGIILAVEKNGETAYLATFADLSSPSSDIIVKPEKGTKMSRSEFNLVKEEKEKEWKDNSARGARDNPHGNR